MKRVKKSIEPNLQPMNIIVVLKLMDGGMLFLYSTNKQWHLPRIQMRADTFLGEFNQLFTELSIPNNLISENLQGIIEISTLPGVKSPFLDSDAVWLYLCPSANLNLSGQYNEYKWVHSLSELENMGLPNIYSEIFKRFEHFWPLAPKTKKNSLTNFIIHWWTRRMVRRQD